MKNKVAQQYDKKSNVLRSSTSLLVVYPEEEKYKHAE